VRLNWYFRENTLRANTFTTIFPLYTVGLGYPLVMLLFVVYATFQLEGFAILGFEHVWERDCGCVFKKFKFVFARI